MATINLPSVEILSPITAAVLNDTTTELTPGLLNEDNLASASIDLAQLDKDFGKGTRMEEYEIGNADWQPHGATPTVIASTTGATVGNGTVLTNSTKALNGGAGILVNTYDTIEINAVVNVNPEKPSSTSPPNYSYSLGYRQYYPNTGTTTHEGFDNGSVWVGFVEWDITSTALSNFVPVPGQAYFTTSIGSYVGCRTSNMMASGIVPALAVWNKEAKIRSGFHAASTGIESAVNYLPLTMAWMRPSGAASNVRIYGLRIKILGICHPYNDGTNNWMVMDDGLQMPDFKLLCLQGTLNIKVSRSL